MKIHKICTFVKNHLCKIDRGFNWLWDEYDPLLYPGLKIRIREKTGPIALG